MKGTVTYWILVDNEKVGEFTALTELNERQKLNAAYSYGKSQGIEGFGLKGIRIFRANTKNDYKVNGHGNNN